MNRFLLSWWLVLFALAAAARADGIGWRNDGSGCYPTANPPTQWDIDEGKNILWQTKVGKGQSTPICTGGRVLLTAEQDQLVCVDGKTGKVLWAKANGYEVLPSGTKAPQERPPTSPNCGYSSPTPVTDGKAVYASYGTGVVVCYDLEGNRQWVRWLDLPQVTQYGRSASPVLADGKLLVSVGGLEALDPKTGNVLWQTPDAKPAYGTPAVAQIGQTAIAITPSGDCVRLGDGRILAKKLARTTYTSPLVHAGVVYFVDSSVVAIKLPEKIGETIELATLWTNDDVEGEMFASPVWHEGILYFANNEGTLYALDAQTGKMIYNKEVDIRSASGKPGVEPANIYPSLTLAGKRLLLGNDVGDTLVLEPGKEFRMAAKNVLDKGSGSSPVPHGKLLFLRGGDKLYCIGN